MNVMRVGRVMSHQDLYFEDSFLTILAISGNLCKRLQKPFS